MKRFVLVAGLGLCLCLGLTRSPALADNDGGYGNGNGNGNNFQYFDDFRSDHSFFDDAVGVIHRRQSGSTAEADYAPGIPASSSDFYARLTVQPANDINNDQSGTCTPGAAESDNSFSCGGPLTEWGLPYGGFDGNFDSGVPITNGTTTSIDIYLDTAFAANARATGGRTDYRFDWDSDLLDSKSQYLQDYIFNVATGQNGDSCAPASGGFYVVEASNNSQRSGANAHNPTPPNPPQLCISKSGWYTFTHTFSRDSHGNLQVAMTITTAQDNHPVASWILHPTCLTTQITDGACPAGSTATTPVPFSGAGANFLGWFPDQEINDLAVDNIRLATRGCDEGNGHGPSNCGDNH